MLNLEVHKLNISKAVAVLGPFEERKVLLIEALGSWFP